ncbi:S-layer homology domain-containing protein [Candidatus Peregrinibacteria bacterium]|nr:S-layer homology domain-containing protein [Candidatus Peregrinibacteria bacterium]
MNKDPKDQKRHQFNKNAAILVAATLLITTMVAMSDVKSLLYSTSILTLPAHAPFDGTTYPIKKVPNWTHISDEKRKMTFNELADADLIDIPFYDANQLATPTDNLKWGNPADDTVRNAKITYSTPYMGNYHLDGKEFGGSHLAVDIKVPEGTPVYAIANGVVAKASNQEDGFGVHVVLQHNNFPSPDDPNKKIILYSSYSHMSKGLVSVGDVVVKGQQIGLSGHSGTATTPHVHFQIDNDQATFHPFWPFTWQQASSAGLDFFSAVNAGLGQDLAKQTTVNPVVYVQKYFNSPATVTAPESMPVTPSVAVSTPDTNVSVNSVDPVSYVAASGDQPNATPPVSQPPLVVDNTVDTPTPVDAKIFSDVEIGSKYYVATKYLSDKGIIKGYNDGTFRPAQTVNRVESLKFILASIHAAIASGQLPFKDVKPDAWYADYLFTAYERSIVVGNPDGTFRPEANVNKAEFFKILFHGLSVDIDPVVAGAPYEDVPESAWFASYIAYAKKLKILDPELSRVGPARAMTRGEVADAMYRLMTISN